MNKYLNYGLTTLASFTMLLPSCTQQTKIHQQAEKLSTWHKQIDANTKMTDEQKQRLKYRTANSEFVLLEESYADKGVSVMTDSVVKGAFIKNGDTMAMVTLEKKFEIFDKKSQQEDRVYSQFMIHKTIASADGFVIDQHDVKRYTNGRKTLIGQSYFTK